jgi:hypothetical protein
MSPGRFVSGLFVTPLAVAVLTGCVMQSAPYPLVPALAVEQMPNPPVTEVPLIWQPGHWNWTGAGYVWQPGEYVPKAGHGGLWMAGYWAQTPSGWAWQPPHWM